MLEVMIAILTIAAFLTGTLQLMAFTALYKVRSERQAQANFWIQEDFEDVKYLASTLAFDEKWCTGEEGYATALKEQLIANPPAPNPKPFVRKDYSLYQTFNITPTNPHRLRIDYRVEATDKTSKDYPNQEDVIAKSSVEVVPDASFECP